MARTPVEALEIMSRCDVMRWRDDAICERFMPRVKQRAHLVTALPALLAHPRHSLLLQMRVPILHAATARALCPPAPPAGSHFANLGMFANQIRDGMWSSTLQSSELRGAFDDLGGICGRRFPTGDQKRQVWSAALSVLSRLTGQVVSAATDNSDAGVNAGVCWPPAIQWQSTACVSAAEPSNPLPIRTYTLPHVFPSDAPPPLPCLADAPTSILAPALWWAPAPAC